MQQAGSPGVVDTRTRWFVFPKPNPAASLRLFCFASAGHGPAMFRTWLPLVGSDVELAVAHLPGRESRWGEPALQSLDQVVPPLVDAMSGHVQRPFALFGHSLGALVAFEVARALRSRLGVEPGLFLASAHRAPHTPLRHARLAHLSDAEFVAQVNARHGGIPEAVASNKELMDLMLPSLRADYRVFEDYVYREQAPLSCPITALGGLSDPHVTPDDIEGWQVQTTGGFTRQMFDGGHFFVNDLRPQVVSAVMDALRGRAL